MYDMNQKSFRTNKWASSAADRNIGNAESAAIARDTGSAVNICSILRQRPHAEAVIRGSSQYPQIRGRVMFYQMRMGVLVAAEIFGLPAVGGVRQPMSENAQQSAVGTPRPPMSETSRACSGPIFGFHIHSGSSCSGNTEDPFADAGEHYNPGSCAHPYHAGDMPPLFGNNGYAFQIFLTDRFSVREIIGKTVIIHGSPDDFTTQPGGNAGARIACGQIVARDAGTPR